MELSVATFNYAVELKRQGNYGQAIRIYQGEIQKMLDSGDFHEFTTYARAIAKCFYLNKSASKAMAAYHAIIQFNMLAYPQFVRDMTERPDNVARWIADWAPEIGYTLKAAEGYGYDSSYANAIAGKGGEYSKQECFNKGWDYVVKVLEEGPDKQLFFDKVWQIT